ncbi:hypothetical protein [Undibacterium sp. Di24W]|uniref:hypothetical protein n=1 Tax=Undibacterium sp. Di24W TaxID=3413033 RepID=UPI003BF51FDF
MMLETLTDVGIYSEPGKGTQINFAHTSGQSNASDFIGVYPNDKQTGISLTHNMESPNPFSDLEMTIDNMCKQTSYPISLQSQSSTTLAVTSFTIRETGTTVDLPARILLPNSRNIASNFAAVIGKAPFKPNTNYTVKFIGSVAGGKVGKGFNVDKSWSFTTASKNWMTCN